MSSFDSQNFEAVYGSISNNIAILSDTMHCAVDEQQNITVVKKPTVQIICPSYIGQGSTYECGCKVSAGGFAVDILRDGVTTSLKETDESGNM